MSCRKSPGQAGDLRSPDFPGHRPHRLEIPLGRKGETGLDDIHVEEFQMPGDLQFFVHVEIGAGGLFPVPQGRIEDKNFVCHMKTFLFLVGAVRSPPLRLGNLFSAFIHQLAAPRQPALDEPAQVAGRHRMSRGGPMTFFIV